MATITYHNDAPGRGGSGPLFVQGGAVKKVVFGTFAFDNSYPTGGEDISDIFSQFNDQTGVSRMDGMWIEQPLTGAQTGKFCKVDYTNKKLLLYTNASPAVEVAGSSDQSAISGASALRFIAWGPRK